MYTKEHVIEVLRQRWSNIELYCQSGNSWVYKVMDNDYLKAVKVLRRDRYARFSKEVQAVHQLSTIDGVLPILEANLPSTPHFDNGADLEHIPFFTMPFITGSDLSRKHLNGKPCADKGVAAVEVILRVVRVISTIHDKGKAHRDLKPENVLSGNDGKLWVCDFGLCIDLSDSGEIQRDTASGELIGSVLYRAPEYLRGRLDESDHRPGDVYSIGRMLWSLLVGRHPDYGMTEQEFEKASVNRLVPGLHKGDLLHDIIKSATTVDRSTRINIRDLADALNEWLIVEQPKPMDELKRILEGNDRVLARRADRMLTEHLDDVLNKLVSASINAFKENSFVAELKALPTSQVHIVDNIGGHYLSYVFTGQVKRTSMLFDPRDAMDILPELVAICGIKRMEDRKTIGYQAAAAAYPPGQQMRTDPLSIVSMQHVTDVFNAAVRVDLEKEIRKTLDWLKQQFESLRV